MRQCILAVIASAIFGIDLQAGEQPPTPPAACDGECQADSKLGTLLNWAESPNQAAALARRQDKLVFLIHVSGNFAISGYT